MQDLKIFRFLMAACIFGITSCTTGNDFKYLTAEDPGTATIKIYKNNNSTSKNRFIAPKNVTISQTYQSLSGKLTSELSFYCPSVGDVNLLVIPVKTPGDITFDLIKELVDEIIVDLLLITIKPINNPNIKAIVVSTAVDVFLINSLLSKLLINTFIESKTEGKYLTISFISFPSDGNKYEQNK